MSTSPVIQLGVLLGAIIFMACSIACGAGAGTGLPKSATPTPNLGPRVASPRAATVGSIPTAVRIITAPPDDVVLRPADLPPGYRISSEYAITAIEHSGLLAVGPQPPPGALAGVGRHVVLTRADGRASDGVASIASSAVRYETTIAAALAFGRLVAIAPGTPVDQDQLGDETRRWRYATGGVIVDELAFRVRNYLLAVIVVIDRKGHATGASFAIAQALRSKVSP